MVVFATAFIPWANSFKGQESPLPNDILSSLHPGRHTCLALQCSTPKCQYSCGGGSSSSSSSCCCCCGGCCCGCIGRSSGRSNGGSSGTIVGTAAAVVVFVVVVLVVRGLLHFVHASYLSSSGAFSRYPKLKAGPPDRQGRLDDSAAEAQHQVEGGLLPASSQKHLSPSSRLVRLCMSLATSLHSQAFWML